MYRAVQHKFCNRKILRDNQQLKSQGDKIEVIARGFKRELVDCVVAVLLSVCQSFTRLIHVLMVQHVGIFFKPNDRRMSLVS